MKDPLDGYIEGHEVNQSHVMPKADTSNEVIDLLLPYMATPLALSRGKSSRISNDILRDVVDLILALAAERDALKAETAGRHIKDAPKGVPVLVYGGVAMLKTGGEWFTGMEEPLFTRRLEWEPDCWWPLPKAPEATE